MENSTIKTDVVNVPLCNSRCTICKHPKIIEMTEKWHNNASLVDLSVEFDSSVASLSRHFSNYRKNLVAVSGRDLSLIYAKKVDDLKEMRKKVLTLAMVAFDDVKDQYLQGHLTFSPQDFAMFVALAVKIAENPNAFNSDTLEKELQILKERRLSLPSRQQSLGFSEKPFDDVSVS